MLHEKIKRPIALALACAAIAATLGCSPDSVSPIRGDGGDALTRSDAAKCNPAPSDKEGYLQAAIEFDKHKEAILRNAGLAYEADEEHQRLILGGAFDAISPLAESAIQSFYDDGCSKKIIEENIDLTNSKFIMAAPSVRDKLIDSELENTADILSWGIISCSSFSMVADRPNERQFYESMRSAAPTTLPKPGFGVAHPAILHAAYTHLCPDL